MSDAAKASVLSLDAWLDVIDATASKSSTVMVPCLENKRQVLSLSPSPTSGLLDAKAREVAEVRVAGTYYME